MVTTKITGVGAAIKGFGKAMDFASKRIAAINRKVKKSGLLNELRERRYYTKKSTIRRMKRLKRKRLAQEATRKYKEKFEN